MLDKFKEACANLAQHDPTQSAALTTFVERIEQSLPEGNKWAIWLMEAYILGCESNGPTTSEPLAKLVVQMKVLLQTSFA